MPDNSRARAPMSRRSMLGRAIGGGAALAFGGPILTGATGLAGAEPSAPGVDSSWKKYPFSLWPGDERFDFPFGEGRFDSCETDTWFVSGRLAGADTGTRYAFFVIYCKNRLAGAVRADFHTFALFDLDSGDFGTFTDLDFPPLNVASAPKMHMAAGSLDLGFDTTAGPSRWWTRRDSSGSPVPFAYAASFRGTDRQGRSMALDTTIDPERRPSSVGGDRGLLTCFGQPLTGSYFQTRPVFDGTISWRGVTERVTGHLGHIDRQWFPKYAGVASGVNPRGRSHEWRQLNFENGVDMSVWRQFDRTQRNQVVDYSGGTRLDTSGEPVFATDVAVEYLDFEKWPADAPVVVPPYSPNRYVATTHRLRIPSWNLDVVGTPSSSLPAHSLPVEYAIGPVTYDGTLDGNAVSAFGMSERTLALYRDWELTDVLRTVVASLPDGPARSALDIAAGSAAALVDSGQKVAGVLALEQSVRPLVAALDHPRRAFLLELIGDIATAPQ